jgi:hypothetical protein
MQSRVLWRPLARLPPARLLCAGRTHFEPLRSSGLETHGKGLSEGSRLVQGAKKVFGNLREFARGSPAVPA